MKFRATARPPEQRPADLSEPVDQGPVAVEQLVLAHQAEVWHYLRAAGCDRATAEDLAQEAFLIAVRKEATFANAPQARAYLRAAARYLVLQRWRRGRRGFEVALDERVLDALDGAAAAMPADSTWLDALRVCVGQLQGRRRRAVQLFYFEGLSRDETAAALGMQPTGIKTLLQRVRQDLKHCIESQRP